MSAFRIAAVFVPCLTIATAGIAQPALERLERQLQNAPIDAPAVTRESGYLGVVTRNNDASNGFIRVVEVVPEGPSAAAGLRAGDVILSIDGRLTRQMNDLATALQGRGVGDRITVAILRGEEERTLNVTLGRRAQTADGPTLIAPQTAEPKASGPVDATARKPPPPPEPDARSDQSRIDLLERRVAELERRLAELERLLNRRP